MTKNLLPTFGETSKKDTQQKVVPKPVSPLKIKTEPRLKFAEENKNSNGVSSEKVVLSMNGGLKVRNDIVEKEKKSEQRILELAKTVKNFVHELSDMFHDEHVVAAMEHLKKIGGDLHETPMPVKSAKISSANIGGKQTFQSTPTGLLHPRGLDFSPQTMQNIKHDSDSPPRHRQMFPGMKRQSFDIFRILQSDAKFPVNHLHMQIQACLPKWAV